MHKPLFALIDCNNFFASCEQVFRPGLAGKPLVVLSSNDGCAIARSAEAKALGIPMAAPAFKYHDVFKKHGVLQFSANFELYGDISRRITEILTSITPRLEVYSIDESFLDISRLDIPDYQAWAENLRDTILQWVGVPISVGIAPSKTLAKLASERAKKDPALTSVLILNTPEDIQKYTAQVGVEGIWGIGRKLAPRLRSLGLDTAFDVARLNPLQGRKIIGSVHGERLVRELRGQCCLPLGETHVEQKMISASRTFGKDTDQAGVVEAALASFIARTTQKLRVSKRNTTRLSIFFSTDRHKPGYRSWAREAVLPQPTADTGYLTSLACKMFNQMYEPGVMYHRGGALLSGFTDDSSFQADLLGYRDPAAFDQARKRMHAIDELSARYGKSVMYYATEKLAGSWLPRSNIRSPRYTTRWEDLPRVGLAKSYKIMNREHVAH